LKKREANVALKTRTKKSFLRGLKRYKTVDFTWFWPYVVKEKNRKLRNLFNGHARAESKHVP
jgi:hypothetical protein